MVADWLTEEQKKMFLLRDEIEERLSKGESALALAIEGWEKKRDAIGKIPVADIPINEDACALCIYCEWEGCTDCSICPLDADYHCGDDDSPYDRVNRAFQIREKEDEALEAANYMINCLQGLEE